MSEDIPQERQATVRDGRTVAWTEVGDDDGTPLLRFPGTPGSRWSIRADRSPWSERSLRVLTTERPGYGASTRLPGRRFREHADDVAEILDSAGISAAFVSGGSGAAPHILAFAAQHPDRVRAVSIHSGAAPLTAEQRAQMIPLNQESVALARAGDRDGLVSLLVPIRDEMLADPLTGIRAVMADAPPEDGAVMSDPLWQSTFVRAVREALAPGVDGWVDESLAIGNDWVDISLASVTSTVTWWHAENDHNAPLEAARSLVQQLPAATLQLLPGGGHLAAYHHEPAILDELLARG
jgi:pimeloyl-ACP methyl ester carboxylesterase